MHAVWLSAAFRKNQLGAESDQLWKHVAEYCTCAIFYGMNHRGVRMIARFSRILRAVVSNAYKAKAPNAERASGNSFMATAHTHYISSIIF
jgi:hypothetical protein